AGRVLGEAMRKLLTFLLIFLAILGVGDWLATTFAEGAIERRIEDEIDGQAEVEIGSWPVVARALATEEVSSIAVELAHVRVEEIEIDSVRIEVTGVKLSRSRVLGGDFKPKDIDGGSITVVVSTSAIAESAGISVASLDAGTADVRVDQGNMVIEASGAPPVSIPFPQEVLPCSATGTLTGDTVELRCTVEEIPELLLRNLS
ncbi:MAG TPA: LmeA family phospholipid-binding protein, partial [Actinomycetota bacterium]|nr:LmeA family phospholipid-binding protein [Actinomycetota bacterium]